MDYDTLGAGRRDPKGEGMKMLKEEKWMFRLIGALTAKENHKVLRKAFRQAVRAVRLDEQLRNQCGCDVCVKDRGK